MRNLIVELKQSNKTIKTWQLSLESGASNYHTVGTSKFADIQISSPGSLTTDQISGIFEFKDQNWKYIQLDTSFEKKSGNSIETIIKTPLNLKLGSLDLVVTPFSRESKRIYQSVSETPLTDSGKKTNLVAIYQEDRCLKTFLLPNVQTFSLQKHIQTDVELSFDLSESPSWSCREQGPYQVFYKTVTSPNQKEFLQQSQKLEKKDWIATWSVLGIMSLVTSAFFLIPKQNLMTLTSAPKAEPVYREVTLAPKPEETKPPESVPTPTAQMAVPDQPAKTVQTQSSGGGASQAASAIKSISMGRVSQLVGKISATAGKSKNLVITSGVSADKGTTGRALSAIGSIEKSGTDWSKEGSKTGSFVAANGKVSNTDVRQGQLVTGKTGKSGVGLLDDESQVIGGLDREVIAAYIKSQLGQILYCYERQLSADPNLYGKIAVRFTIGSLGAVETQRISETTLRSASVENCILQRVAAWKFPVPEGGTKVNVTYPFLFKSTN